MGTKGHKLTHKMFCYDRAKKVYFDFKKPGFYSETQSLAISIAAAHQPSSLMKQRVKTERDSGYILKN